VRRCSPLHRSTCGYDRDASGATRQEPCGGAHRNRSRDLAVMAMGVLGLSSATSPPLASGRARSAKGTERAACLLPRESFSLSSLVVGRRRPV
jgi:hypothetical protein